MDFEKTGETIKIPYNSKLKFKRIRILLPNQNLMFIKSNVSFILVLEFTFIPLFFQEY